MNKVIFIDVDGTLVNEHGVIPESAKVAIKKARENGHLVFICTGRSKAELFPDILNIGFSGIIGAAGGYIEIGEEVLLHERVQQEDVKHAVHFFNTHGIDFYLESNGGLFASNNCKKKIRFIIEKLLHEHPEAREDVEKGIQPFHDSLIENGDLMRDDINKISFLGSSVPIERIQQEFEDVFTVIPSTVPAFGSNSGELSLAGIHKATAIEKLIKHLKIKKKDTFAYGDGLNDLEMIEFVQYGIAMGNAKEALKVVADDVTDTPDNDGIYNSFQKYGLI
ncbi:Cof-type HAD-IIB family hydrolase [Salipaludibacillus agaradhaerens]|uniref:Cof-type HAD-IIB family hydrolase n=1 Tax=Salipaludibacillus agaradhaerens TaxID=76935 RepID=UPI002151AFEB|nr:Cof-type HAD-IIB family hydrolase [Salipaludibacillus agaradhaerens]MCR6107242.1 Cof-type HAD-IIB family hydrolase [Salipaludibacillus agaradhaerens]MCR6119271.1 Cof-type HAD-IIB family hydrolase [Salipaludibacillus agaradhaerens]UJW58310.1 Cof-type HAD-IIB family hydrolase [Bacillus sp. A116_S68]